MQHLSKFKDCSNLQSLVLAENMRATQDLKTRHNDIFLELIEWLGKCNQLRDITISNFVNATDILTPFLQQPGIKLETLELEGYSLAESKDFHVALSLHKNLKSLYLKGEDSEAVGDNDAFVESLSRLGNLKVRVGVSNILQWSRGAFAGSQAAEALWRNAKISPCFV